MRKRQLDISRGRVNERRRRFASEPAGLTNAYRTAVAAIIRILLRIYNRFEIVGQQHLRTNRSLVMVANHSSHLDTLCLLAALPLRNLRRAFPVAAADYFSQTSSRLWIAGVVNALPIARKLHVRDSLSKCADVISRPGNILIMFPEGTRSVTGETQQFKPGLGALVAGRDVLVVPCYLDGTFAAWPKGRKFPRPKRIRLVIGSPRNYGCRPPGKASGAAITAEVRSAIEELRRQHGSH